MSRLFSLQPTSLSRAIRKDYQLYLLLVLPIAYYIIFRYIPMYGIVLAFRKHLPGKSIFGERWVGLMYFKIFLGDSTFWRVFRNTVLLSAFNLLIGFPIPIAFALLLNEIRNSRAKKFVQTISYLPRFFSTVVVVGMMSAILSPSTGIVNNLLASLGMERIFFMNDEGWFRPIYIISDVWQFMGWNAIIYIAALAGVDPQLYEAALMDGANRRQQTRHITIPGILPTITINFILAVGYMLSLGFEKVLLMYTPNIYDTADILQTYVYRIGLVQGNFSYSTAVGLFQAVVSLLLLWSANQFARRTSDYSLW